MNPLKVFTTPEYLFRPTQILTRLQRAFQKSPNEREVVELPWGTRLLVRPNEVVGSNIWYYGVVDLAVAEAISRLLAPSEVALDIGANIGQMTSLMRVVSGPKGRVYSFEPHPQLFAELRENMERFKSPNLAPVELHDFALSDREGRAVLDPGPQWHSNRGLARVVAEDGAPCTGVNVKVRPLADVLPSETEVGLCKLDVEEHELQVLRGAERLLRGHQIRDIIFEDFGTYPTEVQKTLLDHGFTLFSLHVTLLKPELKPLTSQPSFDRRKEGCDFVATLAPERARKQFESFGWKVLKSRS